MQLTGSLLERAQQAIVSAYTREELRQFVHIELGETFEAIVRDDNLSVQAFELLLWADRQGRTQELLDKLAADRPKQAVFATLAAAFRSGEQPTLDSHRPVPKPFSAAIPLQKPLRVQHFTGRDLELARLLDGLKPGAQLTLSGPGGMGKTALAAEAVWRLAPKNAPPARFPDGVLFHTFYHQPQADVALGSIARAYGVDPNPNPREAARRALGNRKALLVLDGTEAADDLRAVLSVAGSCGVLITTRQHADAPADYQDIEPLPRDESLTLLRAWAGAYADDDEAANDTVRLLGGLPLAIFLVGRYLSQRRQTAGEYVQWLKEEGLEALRFGDRPSRSVPLLLARSLEQVSERARRAFGVAGVLALAPFDAEIVAAALATNPSLIRKWWQSLFGAKQQEIHPLSKFDINQALGELVEYGLLLRPDARYQVTHALAHSYARTHAVPDGETVARLALHYAALAKSESKRGPAGFAVLDDHRAHIVAVQAAAQAAEQWHAVRRITWQVRDYLNLKGYWTDRLTVLQAGLDAALADAKRYDEMAFANELGLAHAALGRPRQAIEL